MVTKQTKKSPTGNRVLSPHTQEGISTSVSPGIDGKKKGYANIWPEWSDADINSEKWETAHKGGKEKEKGKSPVSQYFDDPQGKIDLPGSLRVDHWKRPHDYIVETTPVIVDQSKFNWFDLFTLNGHIHHSELMRYVISEIVALWYHGRVKVQPTPPGDEPPHVDPALPTEGDYVYNWRPWEHIYSINKVVKGPTIPAYNQYGKYAVKLYFLGCWRKILVDDTIPCNDADELLLPVTGRCHEIWPLLLTKALVKVASLDYNGGNTNCEFGDFSVISCLTGWLPESIPIKLVADSPKLWSLLKASLPNFKLPEPPKLNSGEVTSVNDDNKNITPNPSEEKAEKSPKPDSKPTKPKSDKGKDGKDKKASDKDSKKEKSMIQEDFTLPDHPEYVVFASYSSAPKYPSRVSALSECATASEHLRMAGFSPSMCHPVALTQCRDCPLEPPPIEPVVPAWKLIRSRKPRSLPSAEPMYQNDVIAPIQSIEICSPYINMKSSTISIPMDTHRPNSTLTKGGTHVSRPNTGGCCSSILEEDATNRSNVNLQLNADQIDSVQSPISRIEETVSQTPFTNNQTPVADLDSEDKKKNSLSGDKSAKSRGDVDLLSAKSKTTSASKRTKKLLSVDINGKNSKSPISNATDLDVESTDDYESTVQSSLSHVNSMWIDFNTFCKCFKTLTIYHLPHTYPFSSKYNDIKTEKVTEEKPDNFIFIDNLKPTELIISFSSLCQWPEVPSTPQKPATGDDGGKGGGGSQVVKAREMRESRADTWTNDISSIPEVTSVTDINNAEPLVPGLLIAEPYSWRTVVTGQPMLRIRTTSVKTIMLTLPAGRHVLKFIMQSPLGCHLHIVSSVNFVFGDEDKVMAELSMESVRFADYASQVMLSIGRCIAHFNDSEAYASAKADLLAQHCPHIDTKAVYRDRSVSMRHHLEVFNESFYATLRRALCVATAPTPGDKSSSTVAQTGAASGGGTGGGVIGAGGGAEQSAPSLTSTGAGLTSQGGVSSTPGQHAHLNGDVAAAWRAFTFDATTPNILGLHYGSTSRPTTGMTSDRGSAKKGVAIKKKETIESKTELWKTREPTVDELVACVKIQKMWRSYWVRNIVAMNKHGTDDNLKAHDLLMKSWSILEQNIEQNGLFLFRNMFKLSPDLISKFPFYKDEWNKMICTDYQGSYPEQPSNTWFIIFREIFFVQESILCLPKLICNLNTSHLRVVDNDTGEELPEVFFKVVPYVFKRNVAGYTFLAEGRSPIDVGLPSGRWRLRLVGSLTPLPLPSRPDALTAAAFSSNEFRDYYIPNDRNSVLRYSVKVTEDHLASIQLSTSKADVYLELKVFENDTMIMSTFGKGHVVLPAFIFKKDILPNSQACEDDDNSRKHGTKRGNSAASYKIGSSQNLKKRTGSSMQDVRNSSRASTHQSVGSAEDSEVDSSTKIYKYMIEATILRDSWPLSEIQWQFVQGLMEAESQEIKVGSVEKPVEVETAKVSSSKESVTSKTKEKPGKKDAKKNEKDNKNLVSRPSSQHFDANKPNYTLRVVSDQSAIDDIVIEKDRDRVNQIRAMKIAWEAAEPGRAAKALQSRLKYLDSHLIKAGNQDSGSENALKTSESVTETRPPSTQPELLDKLRPIPDGTSPDINISLTLTNPNPPVVEDKLIPLDVSQFKRNNFFSKYEEYNKLGENNVGDTIYFDNEEESRQRDCRQKEIAKYREYRKAVEIVRYQELVKRNKQKKDDLEDYEKMQLDLDEARRRVNVPREELRERMLATQQRLQDELAEKQAALEAELNKPTTPKGKKSAKAKSGGKKK